MTKKILVLVFVFISILFLLKNVKENFEDEDKILTMIEFKNKVNTIVESFNLSQLQNLKIIINSKPFNIDKMNFESDSERNDTLLKHIELAVSIISEFELSRMRFLAVEEDYTQVSNILSNILVHSTKDELGQYKILFKSLISTEKNDKREYINHVRKVVDDMLFKVYGSQRQKVYLQPMQNPKTRENVNQNLDDSGLENLFKKPNDIQLQQIFKTNYPDGVMYDSGVPIQDFMTKIIRPKDLNMPLIPPSCIKDSRYIHNPVAVLTDNNVLKDAYHFEGKKKLPEYAYTEKININYRD